jgi:hypothetical protein
MPLDDMIEQLAFGKQTPKPAPCLGLYLSPDVIYLSETHKGKDGKLVVDHLVRIPIPSEGKNPTATATMSTDFLADPLKVAGLVRQSMSQLRWNTKSVRVTLSHHLGLLRYFVMPAVDNRFLPSAVPLEAKKYIPIPFDVLAHDYQALPLAPDATGKPRLGVLIAVTQKKNIANVEGLLKSLDLTLDGIEVAPLSVLRLWQAVDPAKDPAPFLHVHMDGGSVRIMVVEKGVPVFFREVFLGETATLDDLRRIDLPGCVSFVQKQLNMAGLARLRVSGNLPDLEAFKNAFSQETGLPAVIQDMPKLLSVKSGDWGGYAALGGSGHLLFPSESRVDLVAQDRITDEERRTARDIILGGAVLAGLLAVTGVFKSLTYNYKARELRRYRVDPDIKATLAGMDESDMQRRLADMKKQLDALKAVTATGRPDLSTVLREIITQMPTKIWLDHITITSPLMGADKDPMQVTLRGHAQDASVSLEQNLVFQFNDTLQRSTLGKDFDIQLTLTKQGGSDAAAAGVPGMDPKALAEKLEGRTSFILDLRSKH